MPTNEDAIHGLHAGILRAYHAETLLEIWTSERDAGRDRVAINIDAQHRLGARHGRGHRQHTRPRSQVQHIALLNINVR